MQIYKRWREGVVSLGFIFLLLAMAQDFFTGSYSPLLLVAGGVLLVAGLIANLVDEFFGG